MANNLSYTATVTAIDSSLNVVYNSELWITSLDTFRKLCGEPIAGQRYHWEIDITNKIISITMSE